MLRYDNVRVVDIFAQKMCGYPQHYRAVANFAPVDFEISDVKLWIFVKKIIYLARQKKDYGILLLIVLIFLRLLEIRFPHFI
jgi:hypothetical protein